MTPDRGEPLEPDCGEPLEPGSDASSESVRATMWVGHATGRVPLATGVICGVIAAQRAVSGDLAGTIIVGLAAAACVVLSRITVMIDRRGVTVLFSRLRWPRKVVPLDAITSFERTDLHWWKWGGWGYRKNKVIRGDTAVLLRNGDGIRIGTDSTALSVSVDDPAAGLEVLADLLVAAQRT